MAQFSKQSTAGVPQETTLVHHVFGGYLRNQVACLRCDHVSKSYECSLSLPLEVPYRCTSLEAALHTFTKRERLDGDNKYKCDK
jgi:ubiquitin carboxyl-terminal hydrolase 36/42